MAHIRRLIRAMNNHTKLQQLAIAEIKAKLLELNSQENATVRAAVKELNVRSDERTDEAIKLIYKSEREIEDKINKSIIWLDALNTSISG